MIIAIDGPAGAGKTTTAKELAHRLGYQYLDTGAMYRTIAVAALDHQIPLDDDKALEDFLKKLEVTISDADQKADNDIHLLLDGVDYTARITTKAANLAVTPVSASPIVRTYMTDYQRLIGNSGNFVVEGRDIGTVVFPNAEVKFFLIATPEARADRRLKQNQEQGIHDMNYREIYADLIRRDQKDSSREHAPLKQAEDAVLIDNTNISFDATVNRMMNIIPSMLND